MLFGCPFRTFVGMPSTRLPARSLLPVVLTICTAALLLTIPMPGSVSVLGTRWLHSTAAGMPGLELISDAGLMLLAATTAVSLGRTWWSHPERRPRIVMAAAGVALACVLSEGGKLVFAQERPCTVWLIAAECPPPRLVAAVESRDARVRCCCRHRSDGRAFLAHLVGDGARRGGRGRTGRPGRPLSPRHRVRCTARHRRADHRRRVVGETSRISAHRIASTPRMRSGTSRRTAGPLTGSSSSVEEEVISL